MSHRRVAFTCIALAVLAGCLPRSPAQIVLEIDTDLRSPDEFDSIEVRVYSGVQQVVGGGMGVGRCGPEGRVSRNGFGYTLTYCREFRNTPPLTLGVVPGSDSAASERVGFEAVAYRGDVEVLRTFDHTQFPDGGPRTTRLFLARACLETVCDPGLTCRRGGFCEEPELPDEPDAGVPTDAGIVTDVGSPPAMPDASIAPECVTAADCPPTSLGVWSNCDYGSECDRDATRNRSVTTHPCEAGVCATRTSLESGACTRETNGASCGGGSTTSLGTCGGFTSECDDSGIQSVTVVERACGGGSCITETFTGTQACPRATNGRSCGAGTTSSSSACSGFSSDCDPTGTQTVTVTERFCAAGECATDRSSFPRACSRDPRGLTCGRAPSCADRCNSAGTCVEACGTGCPC